MKLIGLMPVRDEAWVIGLTIPAALKWCDELVVLNHASQPVTSLVLIQLNLHFGDRLTILHDSNPSWPEMVHRQRMLMEARKRKATLIALVDADEILTGNLLPTILHWIESCPAGQVFQIPIVCPWRGIQKHRTDRCPHTTAWISTGFRLTTDCHWKPRTGGYQHHQRHPYGTAACAARPVQPGQGGMMHLQWLRWKALQGKHALYKMIERINWPNKYSVDQLNRTYGMAMDERGMKLKLIPAEWWEPYRHLMDQLNTDDVESWHHTECRRLWKQHGPQKFQGLDLFGVVSPD